MIPKDRPRRRAPRSYAQRSDAVVELINAENVGRMTGHTELSITLKSVTIRNNTYPAKEEAVTKAGVGEQRAENRYKNVASLTTTINSPPTPAHSSHP